MKLVLQQVLDIRGEVKRPYLAQDAAMSLIAVERDTDGLIYKEMWRDAVDSMLARRRKGSSLIGYSPHNYGLAIDVDVSTVLNQKKIRYEDLLWLMKRRGWYCFRRDGAENQAGYDHFDFLGENAEDKYLSRCTLDPTTWQTSAEMRIWERHNRDFQMKIDEVQAQLSKIGFFREPFTGQLDIYTREAITSFQRAWDLVQTGSPDMTLCRALAFVTADINIV